MNHQSFKEVDYNKYCETCEHKDVNGWLDPCDECLEVFARMGTDKPISYKEKEK